MHQKKFIHYSELSKMAEFYLLEKVLNDDNLLDNVDEDWNIPSLHLYSQKSAVYQINQWFKISDCCLTSDRNRLCLLSTMFTIRTSLELQASWSNIFFPNLSFPNWGMANLWEQLIHGCL